MRPAKDLANDSAFSEVFSRIQSYDWTTSALLCKQRLAQVRDDGEQIACLRELLGTCYFNAAFQCENRSGFCQRMSLAAESYGLAQGVFEKLGLAGLKSRAESRQLFCDFWLEKCPATRRKLVESCITRGIDALRAFEHSGDTQRVAETRNDLLGFYLEAVHLGNNGKSLKNYFDLAVSLGKHACDEWTGESGFEGLVECLSMTLWLMIVLGQVLLEPEKFAATVEDIKSLCAKLAQASQRISTLRSQCLSQEIAGIVALSIDGDIATALTLYGAALALAKQMGDSLVTGRILASMAITELWRNRAEEYAAERMGGLERGLGYGLEAIENLQTSFHTSYLAAAHDACANCLTDIAVYAETEPVSRKARLERAVSVSRQALGYEDATWGWQRLAHSTSKALYFLAVLDRAGRKRELLEESLKLRVETVRVTDSLSPDTWSSGVMRNYRALIKAELANQSSGKLKEELLADAVSDMQACMDICSRWAQLPGFADYLASYSEWYGDVLFQLYKATLDSSIPSRALHWYEQATEYLEPSKLQVLKAPIYWKMGKVEDSASNFVEASRAFRRSAEEYWRGATSVPGLKPSFDELGSYMDAWSTIETARLRHSQQEYRQAEGLYLQAANKLLKAKARRYLAELCSGRSRLERGEAYSHVEKYEAAIASFKRSLTTFKSAREDLEAAAGKTSQNDDRIELDYWSKLAGQRESYCIGRIEMERAKVLDRKGRKGQSSEKFRAASQCFRSQLELPESLHDRQELETLALFCEAWGLMKEAESKTSPLLYSNAAKVFREAADQAQAGAVRPLALANASVCDALRQGADYRTSRDPSIYAGIKRNLESAADCYQEAGAGKMGTWTRATQRLFDALVYMAEAETDREPEKKSALYQLAENHLKLAAKLYGEAGFHLPKREAMNRLDRAHEEREILEESMKALTELPARSGTSLAAVYAGKGQASGLERFEDAAVVGELTVTPKEVRVGSQVALEFELANAGKNPAVLTKLEDAVPEGLIFDREKNSLQLEDSFLDLNGKKLDYMKTHEVKIWLQASRNGNFIIKPRVLFVDGKGSYRSYQFDPVTIRSRGPSVSEGMFSPPSIILPGEFAFEAPGTREVFRHLVKIFLEDYMSKKIFVEHAGWRTFTDLARSGKVPRSAFYAPRGRPGRVLAELERRGLVEVRVFSKERGRGGRVKKVRVAYDNAIVKQIVEETVLRSA